MDDIVRIQLQRVEKLLADRRMTHRRSTTRRPHWLAERGYDPVYGARPLKRVIQKELLDPLALMILDGSLHEGETVRVDAGPNGLVIQGRPLAAAA